jgi:hypothetical protein
MEFLTLAPFFRCRSIDLLRKPGPVQYNRLQLSPWRWSRPFVKLGYRPGLPDGIIEKPKITIWVNFGESCIGLFYCHLWPFGIICGHFGLFLSFWYTYFTKKNLATLLPTHLFAARPKRLSLLKLSSLRSVSLQETQICVVQHKEKPFNLCRRYDLICVPCKQACSWDAF